LVASTQDANLAMSHKPGTVNVNEKINVASLAELVSLRFPFYARSQAVIDSKTWPQGKKRNPCEGSEPSQG
jgi:hypothetical protein